MKIKHNKFKILLTALLLSGILSAAVSCRSGEIYKSRGTFSEIRITVEGLRSQKGKLMVAMFHTEENFNKNTNPAAAVMKMIFSNSEEAVFIGAFTPGEFAVVVFHDEDGNGQLKMNPAGIPLEGFGFSNNPTLERGKPGWKATKFNVTESMHKESIKLLYIQ